jgi:hypothetical protein
MPQTGDVKVVAGGDLLADQRFAPDMIKIDVEGSEQRVLTGLIMLAELGYRMRLLDGREVDQTRVDDLKYEMFHMT